MSVTKRMRTRAALGHERVGHEKIEKGAGYLYYIEDGIVWKRQLLLHREKEMKTERVSREKVKEEDGYAYYLDEEGYVSRFRIALPDQIDLVL